ncbi:MAG: acyl-[acyl-carrier-protein] thioesterase [Anaerolineales bacterium]
MVDTHTETFRIRHDECDAYGVLNNAAYLRLAQETAWRHSIAAGFPPAYYESLQRAWLARETEIEYLQPVRYGETLQVKTFVSATRRALARRAYEFRVADSGELVARAHTDWVFFDLAAAAPATIPSEITEALFRGTEPPEPLKRTPFPAAPPAPAGAVTWRRRVEWRDIDPLGHLNNAAYLSYTEEAAIEAGNQYGITSASSAEAGLGWAVKRSRIEYRQPAVAGDELEVLTWLGSVRQASAERHYSIFGASQRQLLARAQTRWLTVDLVTGKPRRIPGWIREAFAPNRTLAVN